MPLQFHILDVYSQDLKVEIETPEEKQVKYIKNDESDEDKLIPTHYTPSKYEFVIHLFGMTEKGKSIRVSINGFEPFFYIELPDSKKQTYEDLKSFLKTKCNPYLFNEISLTFLKKEKLYGYTNRKLFPFVMIKVKSIRSFRSVKQLFLNKDLSPKIEKYRVYEANLDPMLRFFHLRDISPCGWCIIDIDENDVEDTLEIDWEDISPQPNPPRMVAPFYSGFWDIECYSHSGDFPVATKDPVIQIGIVFSKDDIITEKHIFVLGGCDSLDDIIVHSYPTEKEMIVGFLKLCNQKNPDSLNGYNTFGFDEKYLYERMEVLKIHTSEHFQTLSRIRDITVETMAVELHKKMLSSSALGDNNLYLWTTTGRLHIDLYFYIKRIENLSSYKLDDVCSHYMSGKLKSVEKKETFWSIKTSSTNDAEIGKYVILIDEIGDTIIEKCKIINIIQSKEIHIEIPTEENSELLSSITKWVIVKDDISPADIFRLHRGSDADRALVAKYCIQDCVLVFQLYKKLDVFNNAMAMANTCSVPISFIFTRGQGIKCESLIFKECAQRNQLIEVLLQPSENGTEESYEGAIVLDPTPKFYSDSPVGVADFASLYPSTIYSENISYDTLLWAKDYNLEYNFIGYSFGCKENDEYITPDISFTHIEFDIWKADIEDSRKNPTKNVVGKRVCCYVQQADDRKGTLPDIISKLLAARKSKRKQAEKETDAFKKALLDAEQLAYKLTANSLYGQLGSSMFKVRLQNLAASVTAYGRKQILFAKEVIEKFYGPEANDPRCCAEIVYGDTDSLFINFNVKNTGKEAIEQTMKLTEEAGKFVTRCLKKPHDFEYDKVFYPFIILSKKRYVGNKFEDSSEDYKQTSMGIATKRRDYAPIVKNIYGGAIQILLTEQNILKAYNFVRKTCYELIEGNISLYQLTMTKSLRSEYKMATPPAHKVLANRIAQRDPGNAPSSGTRLQFLYILPPVGQVSSKLQGDRVETPQFIKENKLKIDYMFYLEHQIQNPIIQLFALFVEQLPGYSLNKILPEQREEIARQLLFNDIYRKCNNQHVKNFGEKFGFTVLPKADTVIKPNQCSVPINRKKQMLNSPALQRTLIQQFDDIKRAKKKVIEDQKKSEKEKLKKLTLEL